MHVSFDLTIRPWQLDIIQRNRTLWIKLQLTVMIDGYSNDSVISYSNDSVIRQCFNTKLKHSTNSVLVHVMLVFKVYNNLAINRFQNIRKNILRYWVYI